VNKYLGETIDIHSGGQDLIFPHHENEIAQSECCTGKPFARYWMHNGYINVDNQKMSKSLGNFFTVRDVAQKYDYEVIRFFMLSAHYRSVINFADDLLAQSEAGLNRLYNCISNLEFLETKAKSRDLTDEENKVVEKLSTFREQFKSAMDDDLNTADAIAAIFDLAKYINSENKDNWALGVFEAAKGMMRELGDVLGIFTRQAEDTISDEAKVLIEKRNEARTQKDWATSDKIRDELMSMGIEVLDTRQGVKIRVIK
ncbi:MAG: class I tRNA ligase family protein, partial [Clostridia bacterium]|nr:class I tRNA ligase family protein [Clostridia bacterium]